MRNKYMLLLIWCLSHFGAQAQSSNGLVLQMLFNGDCKDQTQNKNHATAHGGVTYSTDRFGSPCGAIAFNGSDAYLSVPSSRSLESPENAITIAAWVNINPGTENKKWMTICCKGTDYAETASCPQYRLQGTMITLSLNTEFTEVPALQMDFNTWYHYAMSYDGAQVLLYLNGQQVFSYPYSGTLAKNQMPLEIGRDIPGTIEYFLGSLDDLRIYNRALSAVEIQTLFKDSTEKSSPKPCKSGPGDANPPIITFQRPIKRQAVNLLTLTQSSVTIRLNNVDRKNQIKISLNGTDAPFSYDQNARIVTIPVDVSKEPVVLEIIATNKVGSTADYTTLDFQEPPPVAKPAPAPTPEVGQVKVVANTLVASDVITIACYDHRKFDGDSVTILLDNDVIFDRIQIAPKAAQKSIKTVSLQRGREYQLIAQSVSEGTTGPTTLTIEITDRFGKSVTHVLESKKGVSEALSIKCR